MTELPYTTTTTTTVSAPGKILLAGGYTVLESPNVGVVLAVDKKFYSTVVVNKKHHHHHHQHKKMNDDGTTTTTITVTSPQFGATWKYNAVVARSTSTETEKGGGSLVSLTADNKSNQTSNTFVEKTLRITLAYLSHKEEDTTQPPFLKDVENLDITILADNDFYSVTPHLQQRGWDATVENLAKLPKFLSCNLQQQQQTGDGGSSSSSLQKTGLGSSAALTTSLVGALVIVMTPTTTTTDTTTSTTTKMEEATRRKIHNLAQICHCHAQGKVGSGFDVSSATYGSHVYKRFPKCLLSDLLADLDKQADGGMMGIPLSKAETLYKLVEERPKNFQWPVSQTPLSWNTDLLQIMLADVSGGSESPSMARKILNWKATTTTTDSDRSCWMDLLKFNQDVVTILDQIVSSLKEEDSSSIGEIAKILSKCRLDEEDSWQAAGGAASSSSASDEGDHPTTTNVVVGGLLCQLRKTLLECRKNLKRMGDLAGVPVEPDEQTKLANATMDIPGVVASLVPGAGGYDALVVVYVNTPQVRDEICTLWRNYKDLSVCPLAVQYAGYGDGVSIEAKAPEVLSGVAEVENGNKKQRL